MVTGPKQCHRSFPDPQNMLAFTLGSLLAAGVTGNSSRRACSAVFSVMVVRLCGLADAVQGSKSAAARTAQGGRP